MYINGSRHEAAGSLHPVEFCKMQNHLSVVHVRLAVLAHLSCAFASGGWSFRGDLVGWWWRGDKALICQASVGHLLECFAFCGHTLDAACRAAACTSCTMPMAMLSMKSQTAWPAQEQV